MRISALLFLCACSVESKVASTGQGEAEWSCDDLRAEYEEATGTSADTEDVAFLLVLDVDPYGWVALVNRVYEAGTSDETSLWEQAAPGEVYGEGDALFLSSNLCGAVRGVRLSWW